MPSRPRPLDHVVLPVLDLGTARERLTALGFTVAPPARHPFGTENACVYFAEGTFLEPLAVASREECEAAARQGNTVMARDQAYRFRNGGEGASALVFGTDAARKDDAAFRAAGVGGGPQVSFARGFETPSGETTEVAFELAFAADLRAPDLFFFTCERVKTPNVDRSALEAHANGVTGIAEVVLSEANPSDFQYLVQEVAGQRSIEAHSFGMTLAAANGRIGVLNPDGMKAFFGTDTRRRERGLRFEAIVFKVPRLADMEARLEAAGVAAQKHGQRLVVSRAPGQGTIVAFEEAVEDAE